MANIKKLSLKTKLLIYECKERFPQLSADFISDSLSLDIRSVTKLFNEGEIEIPSKMNKEHGRTKKKIYRRNRLLPGRGESSLHERISGKKRPMLRRTV
jgi:hypothetical protein